MSTLLIYFCIQSLLSSFHLLLLTLSSTNHSMCICVWTHNADFVKSQIQFYFLTLLSMIHIYACGCNIKSNSSHILLKSQTINLISFAIFFIPNKKLHSQFKSFLASLPSLSLFYHYISWF